MIESLTPREFDTKGVHRRPSVPLAKDSLATHVSGPANGSLRERFPTRNRIRSYAVRPAVETIGPALRSTDG
jgi:hypothetical protein